ncbi:MAG TPA: hypothetical protein VFT04_00700 [Gemmatimonadales bacterium]|nr:hypothetical protein [Gemmatimonadales bacterium]
MSLRHRWMVIGALVATEEMALAGATESIEAGIVAAELAMAESLRTRE